MSFCLWSTGSLKQDHPSVKAKAQKDHRSHWTEGRRGGLHGLIRRLLQALDEARGMIHLVLENALRRPLGGRLEAGPVEPAAVAFGPRFHALGRGS